MERHRCKLCSKTFLNGRALGGHMRSHLATLPLPPKKSSELVDDRFQLTQSDSSSTRPEHEREVEAEVEMEVKYVLRENPRRSVKGSDPEFYDAGSDVVQDRESETESTRNPTRRRSKRAGQRGQNRVGTGAHREDFCESKRCRFVVSESTTESTPVSSVSDPSQDEEVALCLMMLSRDVWVGKEEKSVEDTNDSAELKPTRAATRVAKYKCTGCKKVFRTSRALSGHRASNRQCCQQQGNNSGEFCEDQKIYECPFCYKVFGSGQALGGHKRSHLLSSSTNNNNNVVASNIIIPSNADLKLADTTSFVLDLNLPAPVEDDEDHTQLNFVPST